MERTRKTSEELDGRRRESCVQIRTQRDEQREREREGERSKGTSWREQGGQALRQTFPKPPERRTQSNGERSEGSPRERIAMEIEKYERSWEQTRRQVGNRWEARRILC